MTEADIGMTEHRSKNTLGRSVPVKTKTDVEEDGTSEGGSPRPVCITMSPRSDVKQWFTTTTTIGIAIATLDLAHIFS